MNCPTPRHLTSLLAIATLVAVAGCASTTPVDVAPTATVFYPEAPAPPRLQFLTSFRQPQVWDKKAQNSLATWILGHGSQNAPVDRFVSPYGMAIRDGRMYVCDVGNGRVHVVDFQSQQYTSLGNDMLFLNPVNITIGPDGKRYICDTGHAKVFVFDEQDQLISQIDGPEEWQPMHLTLIGDELFVADIINGQIVVFDQAGQMQRTISQRGIGHEDLRMPTNIATTNGQIYITDSFHQTVKVFDVQGTLRGMIGGPGVQYGTFARPKGLAIDPHGHIYVADSQWQAIQVFNTDGRLLLVFGEPGDQPHSTGLPAGLYIDRTSLPYFQQYVDPSFEAEYLLFVVNQFGINKIAVYAYGQPKRVAAQ